MEIAEFLLARIDEDEVWARDAWAEQSHAGGCDTCGAAFPRLLAECEAKRRIVKERCDQWKDIGYGPLVHAVEYQNRDAVLCLLALPYADHPDYRPEWAPLAAV